MQEPVMDEPVNVFGLPLAPCGQSPLTGFFRDGCCNTCDQDGGSHTICVEISAEFLACSLARGNDLSSPVPAYGFPGLKPGDRWCVCAARWMEAHERDAAPPVFLGRTHRRALEIVPLDILRRYAVDLN